MILKFNHKVGSNYFGNQILNINISWPTTNNLYLEKSKL